ncbi:MAG: WG repeat-containing protein, partial [Saprospiraceae bacterium]
MKYTFFACLISLVLSTQFYSSPESTNIDLKIPEKETSNKAIIGDLYPILENELWGYMNAKGETVIQPQFHSIGQFSEGLASARLKGTYGFIDHTGDFVIPAQYDMAYSFYKGMAKVYLDTIPYFIDNQGEILFKHNFKEINTFNKYGTSIVKTYQDYYGVINQNGKLIVDTIYEEVTEFSDRLAVVTGTKHNPYPDSEEQKPIYEKGVVDLEGNFVVPFGRYKDISDFVNGLARVRMIKEKQQDKNKNIEEGVMDENGTLRFTIPDKKWHFDYRYEHFSEDVAVVEIYLVDRDTIKSWSSNDRHTFKG